MIPIVRKINIVAARIEAVVGTQIALTAANAGFRVINAKMSPTGTSAIIPAGSGLGDLGAVVGAYAGGFSFDLEMYNNSSIWPAIFLPSCGFPLSNTAGTYQFADVLSIGATTNSWSTISAGLWFANQPTTGKYGIFGAMGALNFRLTGGMPIVASFRYAGVYSQNPGSTPTTVTYESTLPPFFRSFTVDGSAALALPSVSIDSDDYVALIAQPNGQGAILNAWLKKPNYRVKFEPLQDTINWIGDWITNGTAHTFSAVAGVTTGNIITISGTMVQSQAPGQDERDELLTTPLEFAILSNSLTIAFS